MYIITTDNNDVSIVSSFLNLDLFLIQHNTEFSSEKVNAVAEINYGEQGVVAYIITWHTFTHKTFVFHSHPRTLVTYLSLSRHNEDAIFQKQQTLIFI